MRVNNFCVISVLYPLSSCMQIADVCFREECSSSFHFRLYSSAKRVYGLSFYDFTQKNLKYLYKKYKNQWLNNYSYQTYHRCVNVKIKAIFILHLRVWKHLITNFRLLGCIQNATPCLHRMRILYHRRYVWFIFNNPRYRKLPWILVYPEAVPRMVFVEMRKTCDFLQTTFPGLAPFHWEWLRLHLTTEIDKNYWKKWIE